MIFLQIGHLGISRADKSFKITKSFLIFSQKDFYVHQNTFFDLKKSIDD